jgi:hypothetical protein
LRKPSGRTSIIYICSNNAFSKTSSKVSPFFFPSDIQQLHQIIIELFLVYCINLSNIFYQYHSFILQQECVDFVARCLVIQDLKKTFHATLETFPSFAPDLFLLELNQFENISS